MNKTKIQFTQQWGMPEPEIKTITIETDLIGLSVSEFMDDIIKPLLLAIGYPVARVEKYFED